MGTDDDNVHFVPGVAAEQEVFGHLPEHVRAISQIGAQLAVILFFRPGTDVAIVRAANEELGRRYPELLDGARKVIDAYAQSEPVRQIIQEIFAKAGVNVKEATSVNDEEFAAMHSPKEKLN